MTVVAGRLTSLACELGHTCVLWQLRGTANRAGPTWPPTWRCQEHPRANAKQTQTAALNSALRSNGQIFLLLIVFFQDFYKFSCYFVKTIFKEPFPFW